MPWRHYAGAALSQEDWICTGMIAVAGFATLSRVRGAFVQAPCMTHYPPEIAEDLGFEAGMLGGSVASLAVLGAPDVMVLTLTELTGLVLRINRAGGLPLMVDADHGFGNALNVRRTVEELETAGAAGLSIEDTDLPEPFGGDGKARLLSLEEGMAKCALHSRADRTRTW